MATQAELEKNLLVRLGLCLKEEMVSNLLSDLLKEPSFLKPWLEFAGIPNRDDQTISVKSRLGGNGVPDIAVLVESPDSAPSLLAIENKLLATE
ncbi:MAG: hypothetical protein RL318_681, partial [Fibrobacterota bacterium]